MLGFGTLRQAAKLCKADADKVATFYNDQHADPDYAKLIKLPGGQCQECKRVFDD